MKIAVLGTGNVEAIRGAELNACLLGVVSILEAYSSQGSSIGIVRPTALRGPVDRKISGNVQCCGEL